MSSLRRSCACRHSDLSAVAFPAVPILSFAASYTIVIDVRCRGFGCFSVGLLHVVVRSLGSDVAIESVRPMGVLFGLTTRAIPYFLRLLYLDHFRIQLHQICLQVLRGGNLSSPIGCRYTMSSHKVGHTISTRRSSARPSQATVIPSAHKSDMFTATIDRRQSCPIYNVPRISPTDQFEELGSMLDRGVVVSANRMPAKQGCCLG
ncbi:hypothetical protein BCV70DRAFT_19153 [Testicularia cyperi]|uniref:Uncharacterized protein n=1 Tax=Testicularia cyperi TaxID=1882483 RepID=A0A317Y062_9BASI|nr:hypothetical protein BCV70DRAFT_19153 [Testicularia cyperi]